MTHVAVGGSGRQVFMGGGLGLAASQVFIGTGLGWVQVVRTGTAGRDTCMCLALWLVRIMTGAVTRDVRYTYTYSSTVGTLQAVICNL